MISRQRLMELFKYHPETGEFVRLKDRGPGKTGSVAGWREAAGYTVIEIDGKAYKAHRLAIFYMTGKWPEHDVDHKDLNKSNNRYSNLRTCTRKQNCANRFAHSSNILGMKGVGRLPSGSFRAKFRSRHLGTFSTAREASLAYENAAKAAFGEFARAK